MPAAGCLADISPSAASGSRRPKTRGIQSLTSLGVGSLPAEVGTPLLTQSLFHHRADSFAFGGLPVRRKALPEGPPVTIEPALEPLPGEGDTLGLVLLTSPGRGAQHAFSQHLKFQPVLHIIVVSSSSQSPRQAL